MVTSCGFLLFLVYATEFVVAENNQTMDTLFVSVVFLVASRAGVSFSQVQVHVGRDVLVLKAHAP